jgi:hypothetical protein
VAYKAYLLPLFCEAIFPKAFFLLKPFWQNRANHQVCEARKAFAFLCFAEAKKAF